MTEKKGYIKNTSVRIGVDIGGTLTKIGLVDEHQTLIARRAIETNTSLPAEEQLRQTATAAIDLLTETGFGMSQCRGVGIGIPGMVDREHDILNYSGNLGWENIAIKSILSKYIPMPIQIANDADCAVLGEVVAGTAKDYQDVILLTLGTGVGSGVVMDGKLYEGRGTGGTEFGHMVIVENGEPCSCGRRGCFEAYASATALIRDARRATGKDVKPKKNL